jgi:hypothetical protein
MGPFTVCRSPARWPAAWTYWMARAIQGIGAAMLFATTFVWMRESRDPAPRGLDCTSKSGRPIHPRVFESGVAGLRSNPLTLSRCGSSALC